MSKYFEMTTSNGKITLSITQWFICLTWLSIALLDTQQFSINELTASRTDNFQPPERDSTSVARTPRLKVARAFGNHMVLQVQQPIRVWGTARPLEKVRVEFLNLSEETLADENGNWQVELPALEKYEATGQNLIVKSDNERIVLTDVLVGEVWICAGQSNMEWGLQQSANGKQTLAQANDSLLRLHNCVASARGGSGTYSQQQLNSLQPANFSRGSWQVDSQVSAASFSAVGYYFAKRVRERLNVPVGIVNVSVGGTPIESWVSVKRLKSNVELSKMFDGNWLENPILDPWCRGRAKENLKRTISGELSVASDRYGPNHSFKPGFMHDAGIQPMAPMSIRGALWYQGESNADSPARAKIYEACFPLLVDEWREQFRNDNLPVAFVQLPAMGRPNWPVFREYQRRSLSKRKNIGMAISIDTGHPTRVHPPAKKAIGDRLAQWALVTTYGCEGIPMGPIFKSHSIRNRMVKISFDHTGNKLATTDGQAPRHFEIAGADGVFHLAEAKIVDDQIQLFSRLVPRPIHVRYGWSAYPNPPVNLINSGGLPASPFTTEGVFD